MNGMLTEMADDTGRRAKLSYTDGRITSITNAAGEAICHEYDEENSKISSADNMQLLNRYIENLIPIFIN